MGGNHDGKLVGRVVVGGGIAYWVWRVLKPEVRTQIWEWCYEGIEAIARAEDAKRRRLEEQVRHAARQEFARNLAARHSLKIQEPNPNQLVPKPVRASGESALSGSLAADRRLRELLARVNVLLLIGGKGSGKSVLAYLIAELNWHSRPVYVVGVPQIASSLLPAGIGIVQSMDELPNGCVAVIDEAYISHHARNSAAEANKKLAATVNLSRQRDQLLIFVTQEARQLDRGVVAAADMFVIREPGPLQAQIDRPELRELIGRAAEELSSVEGDVHDWAFVHAPRSGFTGLIPTRLPSFWTPEISTMYAGLLPAAGSRSPSELTLEEKIEEARCMKLEEGKSLRQIARQFGVSHSTISNWVNDYPYRDR